MGKFSERPFDERFGAMGDKAEAKFEEVHHEGFVRWGLNRPPIAVHMLSVKVRYAPDYLTSRGFIEVMGVGKDQLLKLKVEKYVAMSQWNQDMPVSLFVWDSANKRYAYLNMPEVTDAIALGKQKKFPEGKPYWEIPVTKLGVTWANT